MAALVFLRTQGALAEAAEVPVDIRCSSVEVVRSAADEVVVHRVVAPAAVVHIVVAPAAVVHRVVAPAAVVHSLVEEAAVQRVAAAQVV